MMRVKPGQSKRTTLVATLLGAFVNPSTLTLTIHLPDGSSLTPTPLLDSTGNYHGDYVIPFNCPAGIGVRRWQSPGVIPSQCAIDEIRFEVVALDF